MNTATQLNRVDEPAPSRPLERIAIAADEVYRIAENVQSFIDRFHGENPPQKDVGAAGVIQVSYRSEIDRLFANLDTRSTRVNALSDIG